MKKKVWIKALLRLGCGLIDYLLLLLPVQLVMLGAMGLEPSGVDLLFRLLLAVYGVLMIEYNNGATVGKSLGRLMVIDRTGTKATMMYVGLRELVRSMYLIPVAGWIAGLISTVMLFVNGRTLHDMVGSTQVIFRWEYEPMEEEE